MPTSAELTELYTEAASVTAQHSKSFYFATRFFPERLAQSAHAVYWFCRHTDDLVDECPTVEDGRRDLEAWARQVEAGLRGEPVEHPVLVTFLDAVKRHAIPHEYPLELIEGMRMDLENTRYRTFDELKKQADISIAHWGEIQKTELADFQKMMAGQNIQAIVVPAVENAGSAGESPR